MKDTAATIDIVGITEDGGEGLRVGDALIGIDNDDCSQWFLSRVKARLSLVRYNDGDVARFTFERLVPRNSSLFGREEPVSMPSTPVPVGNHSQLRDETPSAAPLTTEAEEMKPHIHQTDWPKQESSSGHSNNSYGSNSSVPVFVSASTATAPAVAFPPAESDPPTSATWQHPIDEDKQSTVKGTVFAAFSFL